MATEIERSAGGASALMRARWEAAKAEARLALATSVALTDNMSKLEGVVPGGDAGRYLVVVAALEVGLRATLGRLNDLLPKEG